MSKKDLVRRVLAEGSCEDWRRPIQEQTTAVSLMQTTAASAEAYVQAMRRALADGNVPVARENLAQLLAELATIATPLCSGNGVAGTLEHAAMMVAADR